VVRSFPPVIDERCTRLVLGTAPGAVSLREARYYAHPRNAFWPIVYGLYGAVPEDDYGARLAFAKSKGIALWDVLRECRREGSLDSKIRDPIANDIAGLLHRFPAVTAIYLNGAEAARLFRRLVLPALPPGRAAVRPMPSTSPAHTMPFEAKLAAWSELAER